MYTHLKLLVALLIARYAFSLVRRGQILAMINIRLGKSSDAAVQGIGSSKVLREPRTDP